MFVKSILDVKQPDVITVSPQDTVQSVAQLFKRERIGFAIVRDLERSLIGTVSERDMIHGLAQDSDLSNVIVSAVMTENVVTCDIADTLDTVREIMTNKRTRHVLVMDRGALSGIVSIGDLIKHSLDECRIDTDHMANYIGGQGYN